jgi:hypothetical protein
VKRERERESGRRMRERYAKAFNMFESLRAIMIRP